MDNLHHIVVVGGGAGGLELVTSLGNKLGRKRRARITLVDAGLTHVWKPLLHEVASGSLDASANEWADQRIPSSDLTNLYVGLNMPDDWTITLAVYNVGNDMWVNSQSSLFPSDSEWFGDPRWRGLISSQRPRSFALNFRKNWR